MKKIFTYISLALAAGFIFSSCGKLDSLPGQSKVYENLVVDQQSAEVALNGAYYSYALCGEDYYGVESTGQPLYTEIFPSDFAGTMISYDYGDLVGHGDQASGSYLWTKYYQQVMSANYVIAAVEGADAKKFGSNRQKEIIAEAKTLRALAMTNLLQLFGYSWDINSKYGIILHDGAMGVSTTSLKRSTVAETYDFILSDLDYAIENGAETRPNYYINKYIAMGQKARVLMMRGQGDDYSKASSLAQSVITCGQYALEDNLMDLFHSKGLDSKEVLFAIKPKPGQSSVRKDYYAYISYGEYEYNYTQRFADLFASSDTRVGVMFSPFEDDMYGNHKHYAKGNEFTSTDLGETKYEMRLSEMYLIVAEAAARNSDITNAKKYLKDVEQRAGVTDFKAFDAISTKDEALQEIFNEALRNLASEAGCEIPYLLRFSDSIVNGFNDEYTNKEFRVLPIPQEEFDYNTQISIDTDQNPGY